MQNGKYIIKALVALHLSCLTSSRSEFNVCLHYVQCGTQTSESILCDPLGSSLSGACRCVSCPKVLHLRPPKDGALAPKYVGAFKI
jgi:hypothetical protein